METEQDEKLKSGYQPQPAPSVGRALSVLVAVCVAFALCVWMLVPAWLVSEEGRWLRSFLRNEWLWLTLAGNYAMFHWARLGVPTAVTWRSLLGHGLLLLLSLFIVWLLHDLTSHGFTD